MRVARAWFGCVIVGVVAVASCVVLRRVVATRGVVPCVDAAEAGCGGVAWCVRVAVAVVVMVARAFGTVCGSSNKKRFRWGMGWQSQQRRAPDSHTSVMPVPCGPSWAPRGARVAVLSLGTFNKVRGISGEELHAGPARGWYESSGSWYGLPCNLR